MATTKTKGTSKKIKELKGIKPEKVSNEDLQKLQTAVSNMNQAFIELGRLTASQHSRSHQIAGMQDEFDLLREEMRTSYGSDDINIQDGTIKHEDNVETDS